MGTSSVGAFDISAKDVPLTMYALDIDSKVVATKDALSPLHRFNSAKSFFKELTGIHAVWVRYGSGWGAVHGACDSWFISDHVLTEELPKPFQMYLMLTEG